MEQSSNIHQICILYRNCDLFKLMDYNRAHVLHDLRSLIHSQKILILESFHWYLCGNGLFDGLIQSIFLDANGMLIGETRRHCKDGIQNFHSGNTYQYNFCSYLWTTWPELNFDGFMATYLH